MSTSYKALKRWRHKAKIWLTEYGGGRCQCCGYDKWKGNLDFHHVDPSKKDTIISNMLRCAKSWDKIINEVDKCVLVCNRCHGEIHAGLLESPQVDVMAREEALGRIKENKPIPKSHKYCFCPICGEPIRRDQKHCWRHRNKSLEKTDWPENLPELVQEFNKAEMARRLGVSFNAVKKRLRNHHSMMV